MYISNTRSSSLDLQTRVFVTHNISYLPQVDHIIVLQNGIISEAGAYSELLKKEGEFSNFLLAYAKENDVDEKTTIHSQKHVASERRTLKVRPENDNEEQELNKRYTSPFYFRSFFDGSVRTILDKYTYLPNIFSGQTQASSGMWRRSWAR